MRKEETRGGNIGTDYDRYTYHESDDGTHVIIDTEEDAAWIRSTLAVGLEDH